MHIILLEANPSDIGGKERSALDVCRGLSQRGHRVSLFYAQEGNFLEEYQQFCDHLVKVNQPFKVDYSTPVTIKLFRNFFGEAFKFRKNPGDVVYINQYHDGIFATALGLVKTIPVVCHLRHPQPQILYKRWMIALKFIRQFIAVSEQTQSEWANLGFRKDKIAVVYNGINPNLFLPTPDFFLSRKNWKITQDSKIISYLGRLDREKGLETLIKACALLSSNYTNFRLLIAGKPCFETSQYQRDLVDLAKDLGIKESVEFLGHLNNQIPLYQVSDVTVLPSRVSEPFGRAIIESMSCGIPALGSRIGGIPEILTGEFKGCLFEPDNEQDLSDKLASIIHWREDDPQLGQRCRHHVMDRFTLDNVIDGVEQVLLNVGNG